MLTLDQSYLSSNEITNFILVFLRIITILLLLPIFGDQVVPVRIRIGFALILSFCIFPIVKSGFDTAGWGFIDFFVATLREVIFACAIGYISKISIYAVSIAAQTVGVNMGFQVGSTFNPMMGSQESSFSILKTWFVVVLLITFNIHHFFIKVMVNSFESVPIGVSLSSQSLLNSITLATQEVFSVGLRIAAPIAILQIIINLTLGLLSKILPALNIFVINFPMNFILTFVLLFIILLTFLYYIYSDVFFRQINFLNDFVSKIGSK